MDIYILSRFDAAKFVPTKPTYAIRIAPSWDDGAPPLVESPQYVRIAQYIFDDIVFGFQEGKRIDKSIAEELVSDFALHRNNIEALLVHCSRGLNRSPAVAIALNEAFNLGHDSEQLKRQYEEANWDVYNMVRDAAQRMGF